MLQKDGRISNLKLAEEVHLSPTAVLERVKRLTRDGFILGYEARLNPDKLGAGMLVFIEVVLDRTTHDAMNAFKAAVQVRAEIQECHLVAGGFDYLIKTRVANMQAYRELVGSVIWALPGVRETRTYAVMEEVKNTTRCRSEAAAQPRAPKIARADAHHASRLRRSRPRGRRSCPSTGCRAPGPAPAARRSSSRSARCGTRCAAKSPAGSGIAISPRSASRGSAATACASAGTSPARSPLLLASPLMLTCRQTCSGGRCAGRCSRRRCAIFSRSTECTQSNCSATTRVLLLCSGADQVPLDAARADRPSAAILSSALLHVVLAEAALAGRTAPRAPRRRRRSCSRTAA